MHEEQLDRPLPHSPDVERVVLGAMMLDSATALEASTILSASDFYLRAHQAIFSAMLEVTGRGDELSPVLVAEVIRRHGVPELDGRLAYLCELTTGLPFRTNLKAHAALLREKSLARRALRLSNKFTAELLDGEDSPAAVVERAENALAELAAKGPEGQKPLPLSARKDEQAGRYDLFLRGVSDAVPTGFREVDTRLTGGGLRPAQLVILAARPGMGKSALALDFAANVAAEGKNVLLFSLEMSAGQLQDRLVSYESGLERWKIKPGLYQSDYERAKGALESVSHLPIYLDDSSRSIARVRAHARSLARRPETKPELIVVDYLQLVEPEGRKGSRNDDVGSVSRALKGLAMELGVPVLALSQLSRDCEKAGREPELMDLRDSGELEQDADIVLFLFGDKPEEGQQYYDRTLKCAKQRDGATFRQAMPFNGPLVSFRPIRGVIEEYAEDMKW